MSYSRAAVRSLPVLIALACALAPRARAAEAHDAWTQRRQWISWRAGYAKMAVDGGPGGMVGWGVGYSRIVLAGWSAGMYAHHDLLGRFGGASAIEIPVTLELTRHGRWGVGFHPYLGFGGGSFFYKYYRTGQDQSAIRAGRYVVFGGDVPVARGRALGLDVRMAQLDRTDDNPLFRGLPANRPRLDDVLRNPALAARQGQKGKSEFHWSVKLNYSFAY